MLKNLLIIIGGVIVLIAVWGAWNAFEDGRGTPQDENGNGTTTSPIIDAEPDAAEIPNLIRVDRPRIEEQISSPITVMGEARGTWYFEATAPARLEDANGTLLARGFVTAQGDWMTENFVPFEGELVFVEPETDTGVLIMEKSNPSGLPQNAEELRIPVKFR